MSRKPRNPWDKRSSETAKSFEAFRGYRDLGPNRSLSRLARTIGARANYKTWLSQWSIKHGWVARVHAWDDEQDRIRLEASADEVRAQARRHADVADRLILLATRVLDKYEDLDFAMVNPKDLVRLVDVGVKVGLLARGQPTSRTSADATIDVKLRMRPLADLTDKELEQLLEEDS